MMDAILINSPIVLKKDKNDLISTEGDESSNEPLGLLYIASSLLKNNFSVKVLDVAPEKLTLKDILRIISKEKPLVVGISTLTPGIQSAVILAKALKEKFGSKLVVGIGGPHLNSDPSFCKRFPFFDFWVLGEGELAMVKILKKLKKGQKVKGKINGEIIKDLNKLPFPSRDLINKENYFREEESKKDITATVLGSRGCMFKCIFCSKAPHQRFVRFRSAKNIVDEIEEIYNQGIRKFSFADDTFTLNRKNILDFCQEIIDRKLDINWKAMTRANCIDREVCRKLSAAGCDDLFFGVESGSERLRNEVILKQVKDKEIKRAISLCRKHNIHTNLFLMVGFPTETKLELSDTVNFGNKVAADLIGIRITVPLPGAAVFDYAIENKLIDAEVIDDYASGKLGRGFTGNWPLFIPPKLTLDDLIRAKKQTYRRFYLSYPFMKRRLNHYLKNPARLKEDLGLFKIASRVLSKGKSKGSMS